MPRARSWTDDQLREAVAASRTLAEAHHRLGVKPARYATMLKHIRRLDLPHDHPMARVNGKKILRRPKTWSDEELLALVARSTSLAEGIRAVGGEPNGGVHRWMSARLKASGADTSLSTGQGWARGGGSVGRGVPLAEVPVKGSTVASGKLRGRLIREGLKDARCEACGLDEWQGKPLPLHLDPINGDHTDNRRENLRILCANCPYRTGTWCRSGTKTNRQRPV